MNLKYSLLVAIAAMLFTYFPAAAQTNGSNTPYSRFGMGLQSDQSQGFNRSMGGVAQGLRDGARVNMQNPASYSATDSLTFIFDIGMGLQRSLMTQAGNRQSANNTSLDYVNTLFRLWPKLGMSLGFVPYSTIGYTFSQERSVATDPLSYEAVTQNLTYYGDGGLHEIYMGVGWSPFKNFSFGVNIGYLWGNINNTLSQTFSENGVVNTAYYSSLTTKYTAKLRTWKSEVGLQLQLPLNKDNELTIGATVGIGHKIPSDANMLRTSLSGDTISRTTDHAFQLPMTYSAGVAWKHKKMLTVAADFSFENWANCVTPQAVNNVNSANGTDYIAATGAYSNRFRLNGGAEYVPDRYSRSYIKRINYRAGLYYASPNLIINGLTGPREFGLTAGLGLPISNGWNHGPYVNIGVQWTHRGASSAELITENVLRINIGLTFNESWFMKWRFK